MNGKINMWTLSDMQELDLEFNTGFTDKELLMDVAFANKVRADASKIRGWFAQYAVEMDAEAAESIRDGAA